MNGRSRRNICSTRLAISTSSVDLRFHSDCMIYYQLGSVLGILVVHVFHESSLRRRFGRRDEFVDFFL